MKIEPHDVAVTGVGVVSPLGHDADGFLRGLLEPRSCLGPLSLFDAGIDDVTVSEIPYPLPAVTVPGRRLSRTDTLGVLAARAAAAETFLQCDDFRQAGVVMATTVGGLSEIESDLVTDPHGRYRRGALGRVTSYPTSETAGCVGADLGLEGPHLGVPVACASGAMAIAL